VVGAVELLRGTVLSTDLWIHVFGEAVMMYSLILLAVLQGSVSIDPIHVFRPYPSVRCPKGYSLWWPAGREFDNDKYAQCVRPVVQKADQTRKVTTDASLRRKSTSR
jgi:hypothetical protein